MEKSDSKGSIISFIKGSTILVISNVCLKAINFLLLPLYTSNLTPKMMGISDSITSLEGIILPLLTLGLDSAFSAFYFDSKDPNRNVKVYQTLSITFRILGLIPYFLMLFSGGISSILFKTKSYAYIVRLSMASVSINLWYLPYSLELRLKNNMFKYGLTNVIASLSMILLNILFVSELQMGEVSLVLSTFIVNIEQFFIFKFFTHEPINRNYFDSELLKKMMKFAIPLIPMTLMMWVLTLSDRYVLLYFDGQEAVGLYGVALRFTNLLNVIISAVSMAYTTFAYSSKDNENAKKMYFYVYGIESFLLLLVAFSIAMFGKEIISFMTAATYANSYRPLRDLMYAQAIYALTTIVGYGIYFEKKSIYSFFSVTTGAAVNLMLNIIYIPIFGIEAAAITTLIGYLINYIMTYLFSEHVYPCEYGEKRIGFIYIVTYLVALIFYEAVLKEKILAWLVTILVIIAFYYKLLSSTVLYFKKIIVSSCKRRRQ